VKKLLPFLLVIVYMNSGKVYRYPAGVHTYLVGGSQSLIGADTPNNVMQIQDNEYRTIAEFPISGVERWECI